MVGHKDNERGLFCKRTRQTGLVMEAKDERRIKKNRTYSIVVGEERPCVPTTYIVLK